jgi:small subunit ribosomal protein S8
MPHSNLKESMASILKNEGYVGGYSSGATDAGHKNLIVKMKYVDGAPAITGLTRVSSPGRRLYFRYTEIPRVLNGLGIGIVSTSKGLMKDSDCRRNKAGGELICNVW